MLLVDQYFPFPGGSIHQEYACTLNRTQIRSNQNKFYILQVVECNSTTYLFTRWGRVGTKGQQKVDTFPTPDLARKAFRRQFARKTGQEWGRPFQPVPGKYTLIQMEEAQVEVEEEEEEEEEPIPVQVRKVIHLLSDQKTMQATLRSFDVDTSRLPLGKISSSQIAQGYRILRQIKDLLSEMGQADSMDESEDPLDQNEKLVALSSQFWTNIPFACGRSQPPLIRTFRQVDRYDQLLDSMANLRQTAKIVVKTQNLTSIYRRLGVKLVYIPPSEREWHHLQLFTQRTKGWSHRYRLQLTQAFRVDDPRPTDPRFEAMSNHRLLIHGSMISNLIGIFSQGLRIPSPSQVVNGSILGCGAYFADCISKSYNYCRSELTGHEGFVLLCQVALGETEEVYGPTERPLPPDKHSRQAWGQTIPDPKGRCQLGGIPFDCGPMIDHPSSPDTSFLYNEYVIFNPWQYRFKYLLRLSDQTC